MKLDYEVIFSKRSTIGITVERDRRVVVHAPQGARAEVISAAMERKRFWIWEKLGDHRKYGRQTAVKEFVAGETFLFLGQNFPLELVRDLRGEVCLKGNHFELSRTERVSGRDLFRRWYLAEARKRISPCAGSLATAMGVEFKRISMRDLKYSWASCSPGGTLTFSWRIVQAPAVVIDYLIVHELAHVLEPNHSREFWNIVAVHAPSWERAKEWLKRNGARLEW
jgi:predicted metal-dependent hydrolase